MSNLHTSANSEANDLYRSAMDLKSRGQLDAALTEFRRAVIADPAFVGAHLEIGRLCKDKSKLDRMFLRYAYESFRQATRLDLTLQEAHDQYIVLSQQMGLLENLQYEYENLTKENPDNELLKRCYKNILAISLAMISPRIQVGEAKASGTMKKMIFLTSFFTILIGLSLIFGPPLFAKKGKLTKDHIRAFFKVGLAASVLGVGGILFHTRLD